VVGSALRQGAVDAPAAAAAGFGVVRRRTGGGAVLVAPRAQAWLDVFVPDEHPARCLDVVSQGELAGAIWSTALEALGVRGATVHRGRLVPGPSGGLVCFDSIGPGEVLIDGRKLVGVAQRHGRAGAVLSTMSAWSMQASSPVRFLVLEAAPPSGSAHHAGSSQRSTSRAALEVALRQRAIGLAELFPNRSRGEVLGRLERALAAAAQDLLTG
jgi:hypothetical protein